MVVRLHDRTLLRLAGPKVYDFLQGLVTADTRLLHEGGRQLLPAAFLSAKGRLLADCHLHSDGQDCVLLDVHSNLASNLLRLLKRQRLRLPLEIDRDTDRVVVFSRSAMEGLHEDSRCSGFGFRGIIASSSDDATQDDSSMTGYIEQRVLHGIPEGPTDLGIDTTFPLHGNLDLTGAVSFSKGCYVGQELTTRTKMRGSIRRRFVTVTAGRQLADHDKDSLLDPALALPADGDREVRAKDGEKWSPAGTLYSVHGAAGLCQVKLPGPANKPDQFAAALKMLPPIFLGGVQLFPVLPPYCNQR
jgi:hypothetical protein